MSKPPIIIWSIRDGKAGHASQINGLIQALNRQANVKEYPFNTADIRCSITKWLLKRFPNPHNHPLPDLVIGAGHGTHWAVLAARRTFGGRSVILMSPSLPKGLFDLCIIPEHDRVSSANNVLLTQGVLNPIQNIPIKSNEMGLILIGGESRHYRWSDDVIAHQIEQIVKNTAIQWTALTSRRTPESLHKKLAKTSPKLTPLLPDQCSSAQYKALLEQCGHVWVTEDSISMIYEAITSGAQTGLLTLDKTSKGRVPDATQKLVAEYRVFTFQQWQQGNQVAKSPSPINEANRCATSIIKRWFKANQPCG